MAECKTRKLAVSTAIYKALPPPRHGKHCLCYQMGLNSNSDRPLPHYCVSLDSNSSKLNEFDGKTN